MIRITPAKGRYRILIILRSINEKGTDLFSPRKINLSPLCLLTTKEPLLEIPEVDQLIHKNGLVNPCGEPFDLEAVFLDLFVLGPLQPPIRYKEPYLLKLPCIKPDAMPAALINDDPGDSGKVFRGH